MTETTSRRGIDRRTLLKYSAAGSAALASGGVFSPAIAQQKPIKLGYVSPQTGPLAAFAEADNFMLAPVPEATKAGIKVGNATRAGRGRRQGQPVQSEPRRRGRQGTDRPATRSI